MNSIFTSDQIQFSGIRKNLFSPTGQTIWLVGGSIFVIVYLFSIDLYSSLKLISFLVLFNFLPGLALLEFLLPSWRDRGLPILSLVGFAPVGGTIALLPWWAINFPLGYYFIPPIAVVALLSKHTSLTVPATARPISKPQLLCVAAALLGAPIISLALTWTEGLNPHLLVQGAIAATTSNGFRPDHQFVPAVPLAYNYAAHIWVAAASHLTAIPIENLISYACPAVLVYCSAAGMAALILYAGTNGWVAGLVVFCVFWYAGWAPLGTRLFGRAITWSSILLIGPLLSFCSFFSLVMAISFFPAKANKHQTVNACIFVFLTVLILVASRAPGAIVVLCGIGFLIFYEFVAHRKFDHIRVGALVVAVIATVFGLVGFLGYGTDFDPGSFTEINLTPFPYLASFGFFWMPAQLIEWGMAPWLAGAVQFIVLIVLQAGLLTPFLIWYLRASWNSHTPLEVLLFGVGLAGIGAVFFLESPGGSHFSFLHYTTLSFSLLGGLALSKMILANGRYLLITGAAAGALALLQIVELPFNSLPAMAVRWDPPSSPQRISVSHCRGEPPLVPGERTILPKGASVVVPADAGHPCMQLRFAMNNPQANVYLDESLRFIAQWDTPYQTELKRKVELLDQGPKILAAELEAPSYVMISGGGGVLEQIR